MNYYYIGYKNLKIVLRIEKNQELLCNMENYNIKKYLWFTTIFHCSEPILNMVMNYELYKKKMVTK